MGFLTISQQQGGLHADASGGGPPGPKVRLLSLLLHPQSWWPVGSSPSGVTLRPDKAQGRNRREEASLPKGLWGRREFPRGHQQSWSADSPEPISCRWDLGMTTYFIEAGLGLGLAATDTSEKSITIPSQPSAP